MRSKKIITLLVTFLILISIVLFKDTFAFFNHSDISVFSPMDEVSIHFLDVGQGDGIVITLPNNEVMLIDAGEKSKGKLVSEYIKNMGVKKINYLVATHPHTDHIGGLEEVINNIEVENIYMPKVGSNSKTFENLLKTIKMKNLSVKSAKSGVSIIDSDELKVKFVAPSKEKYSNLNNYSAVIKISYKDNSFLFMGDCEEECEKDINEYNIDVLKVGHHGSNTSSSKEFINKIKPKYAIISVGNNNKYNHPSSEVLEILESVGANIYKTSELGTIVVRSNGEDINIERKEI